MWRGRHLSLLVLAGAAAVFVAYGNSFSVPLLLDDALNIRDNVSLRDLSRWDDVLWPPAQLGNAGRPLLNLTFALNYAIGGTALGGYHVVNLLIHVGAAATLFGIVRRTLLLPTTRAAFGEHAAPLAFIIAALWALHPLQTNAVTYLSQRAESLMGLCYLLTLYCFIRGVTAARSLPWHALAVGACVAGMMTKEVMISAPILIVLYDRTFVAGSFAAAWRERGKIFAGFAASWLVLVALMINSDVHGRIGHGELFTPWTYALTECRALVTYLELAIWPHPLIFDYDADRQKIGVADVLPAGAVVLILLLLVLAALKRRPGLGFLGCWFFVILAPTSSFVPIEFQPMAESRMYLPLAGVIALLVTGVYFALKRNRALLAAIAAGSLVALTHARNETYRTELALWRDTVAKRPQNIRAQNSYAMALAKIPGRAAEAIERFKSILVIRPTYAEAHNNLAIEFAKIPGREADALTHAREAVRLWPGFAEAHDNLGNLVAKQPGHLMEAIEHHETAVRIRPWFAEAHSNLAAELANFPTRRSEAIDHYATALRIKPDLAEAHYNLANLLAETPDRVPEAIAQYEAALRLRPDLAEAHNNLANALARIDARLPDAIAHYRQAIALRPDYVDPHYNLALALARIGQLQETVAELKLTLQLLPSHAGARAALEKLNATRE